MKGMLTIMRYELGKRWTLLAAAAAVGVGAALVSLAVPGHETFAMDQFVVLWSLAQLAALLTGLTVLGEDLASGRMAWFFARPIPASAIAAGKLLGGLAVTFAVQVLLVGPTMFLPVRWGMGHRMLGWNVRYGFAGIGPLLGVTTAIVLAGMVFGVIGRSRSRWMIVDALAFVAFVAGADWAGVHGINVVEDLWQRAAAKGDWVRAELVAIDAKQSAVDHFLTVGLVAIIVGFGVAAFLAVTRGRADPRRAHKTASLTAWSILLPVAAAAVLYSATL
jgi:hypothetical protein